MIITDCYCYWKVLLDKVSEVSFTNDHIENAKQIDTTHSYFAVMSAAWLDRYCGADFASMNCMLPKECEYESYKDYFGEFGSYLNYASDRMNLNRWLYLHLHLNAAATKAHGAVDFNEYHKIQYPDGIQIENHFMTSFQLEAQRWFKEDFEKLYKEQIELEDKAGL